MSIRYSVKDLYSNNRKHLWKILKKLF